jgi:methylenetetrahydrofolate dehydrogenase (NADP+) / methenyltetrahydrofolate cyclohydrolase
MSAGVLDGSALAARRMPDLANRARAVLHARGRPPRLVLLAFADENGHVPHVERKLRAFAAAGVSAELLRLPHDATTRNATDRLQRELDAHAADAVFAQFPFPPGIDDDAIARAIPPVLDVDIMTPELTAAYLDGASALPPVTVTAGLLLLDAYNVDVDGRNGVIVAEPSPFAAMFRAAFARRGAHMPPLVAPHAPDLAQRVTAADLVIAAAAVPGLLRTDMLAPGTVAIDVGYFNEGGRGDINTAGGIDHLAAIAPVPGGIGPMTVSALLERVILFAEQVRPIVLRNGGRSPNLMQILSGIPNADGAIVNRRKLTDYLLARSHPVGRGKARFFERLGFSSDDPEALEAALRGLATQPEQVVREDTGFGTKYIADGQLRGPVATAPVRTIWILETGAAIPRFVTAYPRRKP